MTNLVGNYQIAKSNLTSDSIHLVIGTRKKPEGIKTKHYLLLKKGANSFEYVSSLYPIDNASNRFQIDYNGIDYLLTIDQDRGEAVIGILTVKQSNLAITDSTNVTE